MIQDELRIADSYLEVCQRNGWPDFFQVILNVSSAEVQAHPLRGGVVGCYGCASIGHLRLVAPAGGA